MSLLPEDGTIDAKNKPGNSDIADVATLEGSTPEHLFWLQSLVDLSKRFEFDQTVRAVSSLPAQLVERYTTVDGRFSWHVTQELELTLVGQNLLQPHHVEFGRDLPPLVGIRRTAYVSLRWMR
jgi:iron complex outermembrane receptor protein